MAKELCLWAPCGMFINWHKKEIVEKRFKLNVFVTFCSAPACFGKPKWIAEGTSSKRSQILENFEYEYSYKYEIFGWIFLQVWDILMKILIHISDILMNILTCVIYFDEYSYIYEIFWWINLYQTRYAPDFECDQDGNTDCFYHQVFFLSCWVLSW